MYIFGGWDGHNFLNDLHEFHLSAFCRRLPHAACLTRGAATHTWRQVTVYGKLPAKRNAFRCACARSSQRQRAPC
jgi:hypothetical protein